MRVAFATTALAIGYGLWCVVPRVLEWFGLGWTADFGQMVTVILALSLLGKLETWLATRADH